MEIELKTYQKYTSWKAFQPYFPEEWRLNEDNLPNEYYWKWKDFDVHIDHYFPANTKKNKKLILLHGGGGNGRLMSPVAVCFRNLGYECIAPDLPGFGLTKINSANSYYTWIRLVNDLVRKELEKDDKSIVLCGVSLGGMLAYQVACLNSRIAGLIVTSLADTRKKTVQLGLAKNKAFGAVSPILLNSLSVLTDDIKIPIKWTTKMWAMANDPSFVRALKRDRVGSGSSVYLKFLRTLFEAKPSIEPSEFENCPLLFLQPEKDNIIPWTMSMPFYEKLKCKKEVCFLSNCGHIPLEEPGTEEMKYKAEEFLEGL